MSFLHHDRKLRFDATKDHIAVITKKLANDELGSTDEEKRANILAYLQKGVDVTKAYLDRFVTNDPAMLAVKTRVKLIQQAPEPVLITGPTGTGKELIARAFTKPSKQENNKIITPPFISENCAGFPETLAESIFFGHKKGAFTGAHESHIGLLESAKDGVVFLDEIGDMSITLQAKFLRAIQEHEIRPVGEVNTKEISCRFIAATKYNLEERVNLGLFREDLYGRLMTFSLTLTPLQSRPNDIELITKSMLPNPDAFASLPLFTQKELSFIYKYNVRAIEALLAQWRRTGTYWI